MMSETRCTDILDFLSKCGGAEYKSPKKQQDPKEAEKYESLYNLSKKQINEFGEMVYSLGESSGMVSFYHSIALDGTRRRIRNYFWGELRQVEYISIPESISIFAEKDGVETRYRVALEIDELHSGPVLLKNHNRVLDLPLSDGCVFALSNKGVRDLMFADSKQNAIAMMKSKKYRKIQVCSLIPKGDESMMFKELRNAVERIKPYYEYVLKNFEDF